jgi:hypothetical protein
MAMRIYSSSELSVGYDELVDLHNRGKLNLGMNRMVASKLSATGFATTSSEIRGVRASYHFFTWAPIAGFLWTIYLSFTSSWWWFIIGLLVMLFVQKVNLESNAQNVCDAACRDPALYNELRNYGVLSYQIDENEAERLKSATCIRGQTR